MECGRDCAACEDGDSCNKCDGESGVNGESGLSTTNQCIRCSLKEFYEKEAKLCLPCTDAPLCLKCDRLFPEKCLNCGTLNLDINDKCITCPETKYFNERGRECRNCGVGCLECDG